MDKHQMQFLDKEPLEQIQQQLHKTECQERLMFKWMLLEIFMWQIPSTTEFSSS